jgi:putative peptidoglycan lipid II flippase
VFIGVFARPLTQLMYQRGAFDAAQTEGVSLALVAFAIGLTFNGLSLLLIRSFFSLRQTWIPSIVSAITLVVNTALAWSTYRLHLHGAAHHFGGVFAIALATSVANIVGVALLYHLLGPRTAGLGTRRTLGVAGGTLASAAIGVGLADVAVRGWRVHAGVVFFPTRGGIAIAMAIAIPAYLALGAALGVVPRGFVRQLVRRGG